MSYADIAQRCVEYSRRQGFSPTTMDTCATRLMSISREISEFRDAVRSGEVQAMSLESADIACYAVLVMHDLGARVWTTRGRMHSGPPAMCSPAEMVDPLRVYVDHAFECWRVGDTKNVIIALDMLLAQLVDIRTRCLRLPNDLVTDMRLKLAWNSKREALHGGKNPSS